MALVEDLYKKLSEGGYYTKSIGEFEAQLEDPMYRKKVHTVLTRDGIEDTDFETFDVKYTPLKKKEESVSPSMGNTTSGLLVTPEMETQEPLVSSSLQRDVTTTTSQQPAMAQPDILKQFEEQTGKKISTTPIKKKEEEVTPQQQVDKTGIEYVEGGTGIFTKPTYVQTDAKGNITGKSYVDEIINSSSMKKLLGIKSDIDVKYLMEDRGKVLEEVQVEPPREGLFGFKRKKERRSFTDILVDVAKYGKKAVTNIYQDIIIPSVTDEKERQRRAEERAQKLFDEDFRVLDLNNPEDRKKYEANKAQSDFIDAASKAVDLAVDSGSDAVVDVLKKLPSDLGFEYEAGLLGTVTVRFPDGRERIFDANGSDVEKNILKAFVTSVIENKDYYKTLNELSSINMMDDQIKYQDLQKKLNEQEKQLKDYVSLRPGEYSVAVFGKELNAKNLEDKSNYNRQKIMTDSIILENDVTKYKSQENALKQAYIDGKIDYTTYNNMLNSDEYLSLRENIINQAENIQELQNEVAEDDALNQDLYTAYKLVQEERGNSTAYIGANFLKGFIDTFGSMIYLDEVARGRGRYAEDISVSDIASDFGGIVTEEYTQREDMPEWEYALGQIANYAPGLLFDLMSSGGGSAAKLTLRQVVTNPTFSKGLKYIGQKALLEDPSDVATALMSFKQYEDQFNADPTTRDMPEHEKILIGFLMSYITAKLEKAGASKWLPKGLKGGIATSILKSAIASVGKKASKEVIEAAIDRNISTIIAKGLINTTKAGVAEYVTEAIQTASEEGIKELYDTIKDGDYFEDKTLWDVAKDMNEAGRIGLIGGSIMGSITNSFNAALSVRNNLQTRQIIKVLEDPDLKSVYKTYLKNQYNSGAMSKEEVAFLTAQLKTAEYHFASIPDNIEDKSKAFELITERDEINRSIAGKDEALITGQKERIEQINNELKEISKNAIKKSTEQQQEGTAEGGVVQREGADQGQPQVGQGEGAIGQATQQETDLGDSTVAGGGIQETQVVTEQPVTEEVVVEQPTVEEANIVPGETAVVSDVEITYPTNEEAEIRREERTRPEYVEATSENLQEENVEQLSQELEGEFGLLTAENPMAQPLTEEENVQLNQKAEEWLKSRGYNPRRVTGKYDQAENSFFVPNLTFNDAVEFANQFNQEAVAHSEGLVYQDGTINPRVKQEDNFSFESYSPESNFVSVVKTPEGLKTFKVGYDFDTRTERTVPSQSSMGTVISGTDVEIETRASQISKPRMTKIVANAAKAVSRILPNNKFIVHDTQDSFTAATGETDAGGYFNPASGEIHINLEQANARTVAHEVFHAVLLNAVKTDANAAVTTRKMIEAVSKKIDSNPQLKQYLDEFASNYEDNIQNEEKVSELVGVLAEQYESSPESVKDVIKRWLDRIAKAFGLNPFNRNEVYDVLNTVARKTAKGIEITNSDIKIIEDVNNGTLFENEYVHTNGTVIDTPSSRRSKFKNTVVKESDIISTKEVEGKPLEVVYYDNFTSSPYQLKNRKSGSVIERQGEGGPGYSYRKEIKAAGIIAAFTNVTKGLNLIQGVRSRNNIAQEPAVVGVALQNKETGHLGNLTTARDFYSPTDGVIAQAVNDGLITESDAVTMLKGAVKAYESTKKGQSKKSSLGFKVEDFNTLDEFYNKINDISFERRGTFNDNVIPLKADLKITKATRPYVSTWIDAGIPTLNEYYEATTEQYTKEAQAHDIVKYLDPNLDKIGISSEIPVSEAEVKRAADMGVEIVQVDDALTHTSYPVVLFGNNIGIPSTFNSVREMAEDWNLPNPFFKAGRRKDTAKPVRVPELKETGRKPAPRKQKALPKEVADKLTEDGKGNYIFHHYSGKRRETIQPRSGDNIITSREEAAALSSVGGVAQFYTQEGQKEAGVGPVLHTIVVPKDKVYYLQNDVENFYDEARRQFLEVRPGQAFNANYQAAWIGKVAADNGYDMLVSNWRGDELRAQTVKELTPIEENIPFKELEANVYKVGDEVIVYGSKATITAMDGTVATFKGEGVAGSIDTDRNANLITKVRRQKSLKDDKTLKIIDKNKKYIEDRTKKTTAKGTWRKYLQKFENRQSDIKRSISGIDSVYSRRAYDLLVDKAGASGWADERFKEADKKIYKGLSIKDLDILNAMIYAKRIIAINKNRAERGMKPYTGMDGYSTSDAEQSLKNYKESYGDKKYADFENRTKEYFKVYEENLKEAYDSGRITEKVYNMLKDIDYSPIKTLKYIIGDEAKTAEEIDRLSSIIGMKSDQIEKLGDINENEFVSDTRYLLMASINASSKKGFENRLLNAVFDTFENANDSETFDIMEEFYEYNPVVGTRKDGSLIHKYDKEKIPNGYKEVVFYKDGVKRKMVMKSKYADQLLDLIKVGEGWKTAGKFTGGTLLRFFATSGNPLFIIGNVPADFSNILFISDVYGKIKPIGAVRLAFDFVKNFLRSTTTIKLKEIKREYLKHGGSMSYMAADGVRNLQSKVAKYKVLTYPQKAFVAYGKTMSYLGEKSEEAFRLAVYEKTKNDLIKKYKKENNGLDPKGQDLEDIMYASVREAREVIDFNQGGEWAKNADTVAPYFNAGMQGFRRIREYAAKKPVAFASSMVQAATMAGGIAAYSIAALMQSACDDAEDEDDCNKKMMDALNSLSEYEKSNYHIIFTGKKDENGEYEYIRIKKLPGLSVVTTYAEQLFTKFFFSSRGVDYDPNNATMTNAIKSSLPFDPTGIVGRNPLVSGAVAYMGFDLFKWEETFKKPRGWEDRVIKSEVEGINDDNVNSLFKSIAPMLHMSPARTQAMVEKLITSESTNPTISILYAVANGLFGEGSDLKESFSLATDELIKNTSKKLVRTTNKKLLEYAEQDKIAEREIEENSREYVNTTEMYDEIKDIYDSGKTLTNGELYNMVLEKFGPEEAETYFNKYNNYIRNRSIDKRLLNIVFERKPRLQALYLYERYGNSIEKEEIDELNTIMAQTRSRISQEAMMFYNKNYFKK